MPRNRVLLPAIVLAVLMLAGSTVNAQKLSAYARAADAVAAAGQLRQKSAAQRRTLFTSWKEQLGRAYAVGTAEYERRFRTWSGNLDAMLAFNSRPGTFWKGLGEWGDHNITELQAKYIRPINPGQIQLRGSGLVTSTLAPPDEWDWRPRKAVPPIRPLRKDCSAGWAEAAAAAVQSRAVISKTVGMLPALSVQQLLDCTAAARGFLSKGCAGGYPEEALVYISSAFAASESAYAAARGSGCKTSASSTAGSVTLSLAPGFRRVDATPQAVMSALRNEGPVIVYLRAGASLAAYDGGIFLSSACKASDPVNHAVVIVGYSKPKRVWIVRNTWGSKWGEAGFFRLEMAATGLGTCIGGAMVPVATTLFPRPTVKPPPPPDVTSVPLSGFLGNRGNATSAARQLASLAASAYQKRKLYQSRWSGDDRRYRAWEARLNNLTAWNSRTDVTWFKQLNNFSDYDFSELNSIFLMEGVDPNSVRRRLPAGPGSRRRLLDAGDLPDQWDWRRSGNPVLPLVARQQGKCGSCYAFAALATIEAKAVFDGTSQGPDLSEQQMIDCITADPYYGSRGCQGGFLEEVFNYVNTRFALREAAYPYAGSLRKCMIPKMKPSGAITLDPEPGFEVIPGDDTAALKAALVKTGPLAAYFWVSEDFFSYDSGVYTASNCRDDVINHAVVIVGYGRDNAINQPYWIIQNSWGESWGEGGYARIAMGSSPNGPCGLLLYGAVAPLQTSRWPHPPPPQPSPPPPQPSPPPPEPSPPPPEPSPPPPEPSPPPPPNEPPPLPPTSCFPLQLDWTSVTLSADGRQVSGVARGCKWLSSNDSGKSWAEHSTENSWTAAASSSDGSVQYAATAAQGSSGTVLVTANSWENISSSTLLGDRPWSSIAVTPAGTTLVAAAPGSNIWTARFNVSGASIISQDRATECTASGGRYWVSVAVSANGTQILAAEAGGYLFRSNDSCATWSRQTDAGQRNWAAVAMAADTTLQFAADQNTTGQGGYIYSSSGGGWRPEASLGQQPWTSLAAANLGGGVTRLVAAAGPGSIWTATVVQNRTGYRVDSVEERTAAGYRYWTSVAVSADASRLVAVASNSHLYSSSDGGATWGVPYRGLRARGYTGYSLNASNPAFPSDDDYYYTLRLAMDKVMASAVDCDAPKLGTCFDEVSSRGNITLQLTGSLYVPEDGKWFLSLASDGGARLWLDYYIGLDNGGVHGMVAKNQLFDYLAAGWHRLRIDYYQSTPTAGLRLSWYRPGWPDYVVVPLDNLSPLDYVY